MAAAEPRTLQLRAALRRRRRRSCYQFHCAWNLGALLLSTTSVAPRSSARMPGSQPPMPSLVFLLQGAVRQHGDHTPNRFAAWASPISSRRHLVSHPAKLTTSSRARSATCRCQSWSPFPARLHRPARLARAAASQTSRPTEVPQRALCRAPHPAAAAAAQIHRKSARLQEGTAVLPLCLLLEVCRRLHQRRRRRARAAAPVGSRWQCLLSEVRPRLHQEPAVHPRRDSVRGAAAKTPRKRRLSPRPCLPGARCRRARRARNSLGGGRCATPQLPTRSRQIHPTTT